MPEYLETTVDKFTFKVAKTVCTRATAFGCCPSRVPKAGMVRIGLTDYLQQHSGDIAFVNVKPIGTALMCGR